MPARYNIAPTQPVAVVRAGDKELGEDTRTRYLVPMRWGFIPVWAKEMGEKPLINARAETMAEKPTFRGAVKYRRCLLPANGWYEWSDRHPFLIAPEPSRLFAFAGLWERWHGPGGDDFLDTVAIVTLAASPAISSLHHRMPAVLGAEAADQWMRAGTLRVDTRFRFHAVSKRINDVRAEGAECAREDEGPAQGRLF